MKILVTGSTGTVGSAVVRELRKRDVKVRAIVRKSPESKSSADGVEVVVGDLLDPVSVEAALDGVDKVYLLNAVVPDELTQGLIVYDLAKKRNLRQIVYHSVFQAERFKDVPHFASKLAIENALHEFNVPFTILRPSYFFQNDVRLKDALAGAGVYPAPIGSKGISAVDVRDIAEAAAISLTTDGHLGKTYDLVGPASLSGPGAASIWGGLLQKNIRYGGEALDAWEEQTRHMSPSWSAFDMRMMFQGYLERGFAAGPEAIEAVTRLLGHAPRPYEEFARETVLEWRNK